MLTSRAGATYDTGVKRIAVSARMYESGDRIARAPVELQYRCPNQSFWKEAGHLQEQCSVRRGAIVVTKCRADRDPCVAAHGSQFGKTDTFGQTLRPPAKPFGRAVPFATERERPGSAREQDVRRAQPARTSLAESRARLLGSR